jgi:hypothetical protein
MIHVAQLAFYPGNAFCGAVNIQRVCADRELMVPMVTHWKNEISNGLSYPMPFKQTPSARR